MKSQLYAVTGGVLAVGLWTVGQRPLSAQNVVGETELVIQNVRDSGQPVIPMFEGWYPKPDGTYDLCFGALNLNREQALDIPVGPDNFMEPAGFNGVQQTYFRELTGRGRDRDTCSFTVNVPADIGAERVWWNLRIAGEVYRVPGHITTRNYRVDNLTAGFPIEMLDDADPSLIGETFAAPVVRIVEPAGPEGRGKSGVTTGPITARVGNPLSLTISVTPPEGNLVNGSVRWGKFQGPAGAVTFSSLGGNFQAGPSTTSTTQATFNEPGEYVVIAQVLQGSYAGQCCWTNGYVRVSVVP